MNLKALLSVSLSFSLLISAAQEGVVAVYEVVRGMSYQVREKHISIDLKYEGYIYSLPSAGKVISFLKPKYLEEYPGGIVDHSEGNNFFIVNLGTDTLQYINLRDEQQQKFWFSLKNTVGQQYRVVDLKKKSHPLKWKIVDSESKVINGFTCRKAFVYSVASEAPIWELWFTDEVVIPYGLLFLSGVPGLVVEGYDYQSNSQIKLKEVKPIPKEMTRGENDIFWPAYFQKAKFEN